MDFLNRSHGLPRCINLLGEVDNLFLHGYNILYFCLHGIDHGLQNFRTANHIGQIHVSKRLLDFASAVGAKSIFIFYDLESGVKSTCVFQIRRKIVRLDAAHGRYVFDVRVIGLNNLAVIAEEGLCFCQERIEAANKVITSAIATIQLNFAFGTG